MASKPDHSSDETGHVIASTQHSVTMGDVVAPKIILSDNLEVNGESNQLGASLSHDSLSKDTQSKINLSSSATRDASTVVEMLPKVSSSAFVEEQLTSKADQRPIDERCGSSEDKSGKNSSVSVVNDASVDGDQCYDQLVTAKPSSNIDSSAVSYRVDADRSVGSDPNIQVKSEKDCGQAETIECTDDDEKVEKSGKLTECIDIQNPHVHSASCDENEDSDIVEQDVKVCDICGDAGREDLLAVCSRCSDGAEHTYCMREMLENVPEGDWLCEECKMAEEIESQNQEIEGKRAGKSYLGTRGSGKRPAEEVEVAPVSKKQAMEAGKDSSPSKVGALSRDNSFKQTEKGKARLSHQVSSGNYISKISSDGGRFPSMGPQINPPNGKLSKSSSFNTNSKPKVRLMDEVPHKQKGTREHILPDKEGYVRAMGKSMSFKSVNSERLNSTEPKVKSLSSKYVQDLKGLKSAKQHGSSERKKMSRLDRSLIGSSKSSAAVSACKKEQKLTPRGETALHSSAGNNRGSKFLQSDSKLFASKSTSQIPRKGSDTVSTPVGASSMCGFSASAEKRLNNNQDEPSSSSSWNSDRIVNNGDQKMHDGLVWSRESSQADKCREKTSSRSKQSETSSGTNASQRCRDVGHDAESCSLSTPRTSGRDSSTVRSSGDDLNGNKLKAAITAAMLKKPGIYKRRQLEKSNELATLNVEVRSAAPSHDHLSLPKNISTDLQEIRKVSQGCSSETHKVVNINNSKQLADQPAETTLSSKLTDSDSIICSDEKPVIKDVLIHTSAVPLVKMSTIPEHENIWQGAFQVCRDRKIPQLCDGIQAHLSTSASPKVVEAVDKFPQKILFDEVPRLSTWPSQFDASGARDDNIALYFFAKDIESYERNYKSLLENMMKNDLALKGDINGVELLIFPSNWLPENSQRWNMLYFLWGVFRGRRVIGMDQTFDSKNLQIPSVNVIHLDKKLPAAILSYSDSVSSLKSKEEDLPCNTDVNVVFARESCSSAQRPMLSSSSVIEKGGSDSRTSSINQKNKSLEAVLRQQVSMSRTPSLPEFPSSSAQSCPMIERTKKAMNEISFQEHVPDAQFQQSVEPPGTSDSNGLKEMVHQAMPDVKDSLCHPIKIFPVYSGEIGAERSAAVDETVDFKTDKEMIHKDALDKDLRLKEPDNQRNKRKYLHTVLQETILHASAGTNQTVQWRDGKDAVVEAQMAGKKLKSEISGTSVSNSFGTTTACDQDSTYSTKDRFGKAFEVKCASKEFGTTERHFFPLHSAFGDGLHLGDDSLPWKAQEPENKRFIGGFPNLELALGADTTTPNKELQPLISGVPNDTVEDKPQDKVLLPKEEEDVSASLSLSLSFPFPDGEQAVKPIARAEQTPQERKHVNTSLLLFGAPQEK